MNPWLAFAVGAGIGSGVTALYINRHLRRHRAAFAAVAAELAEASAELRANVADYHEAGYRDPLYELRQICEHVPMPSGYGQVCRVCGVEL